MVEKISDLMLERYLLDELPLPQRQRLQMRLEQDPELQQRLQALEESNAMILKHYPVATVAHQIQIRTAATPAPSPVRLKPRAWIPITGLAATAMLLVVLWPQAWTTPDTLRSKGMATNLFIYRKLPTGAELLKNQSLARRGDLLQLGYWAKQDTYGVILSLDSRGTVTLHYPANAQAPARLTPARKTVLPMAYELDDAPGFERFFFVSSDQKLSVADVLQNARRLGAQPQHAATELLLLPKHAHQITVLLRKGD